MKRRGEPAYSITKQVRQTYLAHQWAEPRSLGTRYAAALADLTPLQRSPRTGQSRRKSAKTLLITVHHGHLQGANKCKGDR